jgi:4-amino-4-deoxy-L-arabinose transferase-like glycosyltransferase
LVGILLAGAAGVHAWQVVHTEVLARDSIGYIRHAWLLGHEPWSAVLPAAEQHPGYPIAILAASVPVRALFHESEAAIMQLSAQLASAAAGVLLVIPMFFLGKELFGRRVGFSAPALFQLLPDASRVLADGLSEGVFFLFAVAGLWLAALALRRGSARLLAATGFASGLAYLTRPEGVLVGVATAAVLFLCCRTYGGRRVLRGAICLGLGWAVVGGPYIAVTGRFTVKPTAIHVLDPSEKVIPVPQDTAHVKPLLVADGPLLAKFDLSEGTNRLGWGLAMLSRELLRGFGYVAWLPALFGLWYGRSVLRRTPGQWPLLLVAGAILLLLYRVATLLGYVSDRHTLLVVLCGCYWAAVGVFGASERLARLGGGKAAWWAGVMGLVIVGVGLPRLLEPLHANRGGFRDAGTWIAAHAGPEDTVLDPYCWTHYYAGCVFRERSQHAPSDVAGKCFVVLERSGHEHARLPVHEAERVAATGHEVWQWTGQRKKDRCVVVVYECGAPAAAE